MGNSYFKFKQFTIKQEKTAMKVGTDGVLLGAYVKCENAFNILDIGTGTGLIALMIAQRSQGIVDAVEIDKDAFDEAWNNIQDSDWPDQVMVFHSSFQEYAKICNRKYELIVSNPPYFSSSLKTPDEKRTIARHNDTLSVHELFEGVSKLLTKTGSFSVIVPSTSFDEFESVAANYNLYPSDALWIKPTPDKPAKRVIIEFSKSKVSLFEDDLIIEDGGRHIYSNEYKLLTKEYYL